MRTCSLNKLNMQSAQDYPHVVTVDLAGVSMNSSIVNNRKIVEILSITGMMALFIFMDTRLGLLDWAIGQIAQIPTGKREILITMIGSMWIGLLTYSYYKRAQSKLANRARVFLESKLSKQKSVNNITGLPNQNGFESILNNTGMLCELPSWSVIAIELSNIDSIRSIHGNKTCVKVENLVAKFLREISAPNEFVAHDEQSIFYIATTAESEDESVFREDQIVDSISSLFKNGFEVNGQTLGIRSKFALIRHMPKLNEMLMSERGSITRRLKYALQNHKNFEVDGLVTFDLEKEAVLQRQAIIETSLGSAIESGQIVPYFQPFLGLESGQIVGFEVLARWVFPQTGHIMPDEFVPIAEEQGRLGDLTLTLLQQACCISKNWPSHIKLAINVSPTDLQDNLLVDKMLAILTNAKIKPEQLEIEITESALIGTVDNVKDAIARLKKLGVSLSIDDFGIGYSSLHQLRTLPFDKIKIDRSFVKDIANNADSRAIVQNVIALGQSLGLPTIAEGVDSNDVHNALIQIGCDVGQGHLYARPMQQSDVEDFIIKNENRKQQSVAAA